MAILCLMAVVACSAEPLPNDRLAYAVSADDIFSSAKRIGLRVNERGNGCFGLAGKGCQFDAFLPAGTCFPGKHDQKPEETLTLSYGSNRRQVSLEAINAWNRTSAPEHVGTASLADGVAGLQSVLFVGHGVSPRTIEEHLRRFVADIRQFEACIRKSDSPP